MQWLEREKNTLNFIAAFVLLDVYLIQLFRLMCVSAHICSSRCNSIQYSTYFLLNAHKCIYWFLLCIDFPSPNTLRTNHRRFSPLLSIIIAVVLVWYSQTECLHKIGSKQKKKLPCKWSETWQLKYVQYQIHWIEFKSISSYIFSIAGKMQANQ